MSTFARSATSSLSNGALFAISTTTTFVTSRAWWSRGSSATRKSVVTVVATASRYTWFANGTSWSGWTWRSLSWQLERTKWRNFNFKKFSF